MNAFVPDATDRTLLFLGRLSSDPERLVARIAAQSVVLRLGSSTPAAEAALALAATLLLRMDRAAPAISVVAPDTRTRTLPRLDDGPLLAALAREHEGFASVSRLSNHAPAHPAIELAFGPGSNGMAVSSLGWIAALGGSEASAAGNPIAASFSGALAANEALKQLLVGAGMSLRRVPKLWSGSVSLWDHVLDPDSPGPELASVADLSGVGFVGCGGISAATFWTLALLRLTGDPLVIDDDVVDVTNLNRLLFCGHADLGKKKVELAKELLDTRGTHARDFPKRWEELTKEERHAVRLAVVSVDDDRARRDIQASLPEVMLNAGTSDGGEYQVSRHNFVDGACLSCIAHGDQSVSSLEENVARHLGLPIEEFLTHVRRDEPLPEEVIERSSIADEIKAELRTMPARRLVQRFCDALSSDEGDAVSAPTLSALPGILLAAEIVKHGVGQHMVAEPDGYNVIRASVLRGPHKRWRMWREKRPGCICTDDAYRGYYSRRYSSMTR